MKWQNRIKQIIQSWIGALIASLILAVLLLHNYIFPLNGILPSRDYILQLWDLWLVNEQIIHGQNPFFTELQYYPVGADLGRHVLSPGFFPVTFLIYLLSGQDLFYPLYSYKTVIWLSYALIFFFSYLTLREVGLSFWASAIPALAYAFGDFYMTHIGRIHIISGFFIPAAAFVLIRLYKKPTMVNLLVCAVVLGGSLYFTEFALFIYMGSLLLILALAAFPEERQKLVAKLRLLGIRPLLLGSTVFLLVAALFIFNWVTSDAEPPDPLEAHKFSANLVAFFIPAPETTPLYGSLFSALHEKMTSVPDFRLGVAGYETFVGFPLLIFGLISLFKVNRRLVRITALVSVIFFLLSLGPTLNLFTLDTQLPMPYALLASIPPFNVGRNPVRFVAMGLFLWMIVAAFGIQWSYEFLLKRYRPRLAIAAMVLIFVWTTAEVYNPAAQEEPYQVPPQLETMVPGAVLNLPLRYHNGWALLPQIFHRQPIATGYVSRNAKIHKQHFETLRVYYAEAVKTGSCRRFIEMGFRNVLIWDGVPDDVVLGLSQSPACPLNVVDMRQ